jgi:hypothetical protein
LVEEASVRALLVGVLQRKQIALSESERQAKNDSSLFHSAPAECSEPIDDRRLTLLVTHVARDGRARPVCLQAATPAALSGALARTLEKAAPRSTVKLDVISAVHELRSSHPLLDAMKLRPASDGVCARRRCFAPWQLVALDAFTGHRPLAAVRDASFGVSAKTLRRTLGVDGRGLDGMSRIETLSYVFDRMGLSRYSGLVPAQRATTPSAIARAAKLAEVHILKAQEADGRFRYTLDPFSGETDTQSLNLPRQAGTTLALCELGKLRRTRRAVRRSLDLLAGHEVKVGSVSALSDAPNFVRLGQTALPLLTFLSCRRTVGARYDALIERLGGFLLKMQREDGSFAPDFDVLRKTPVGRHQPLYAAGQALLALVLLEQFGALHLAPDATRAPPPMQPMQPTRPMRAMPPMPESAAAAKPAPNAAARPRSSVDAGELRRAIDRAMDYHANSYWKRPLYDFFFLEENWHCLAARAALTTHRHDAYERFCIDYVTFKSRIILSRTDGVPDELIGGYGLSPLFPPHNTATAGFGEALAASMAVKQARGLALDGDRALMQDVLGFLVRAQWTEQNCFACARDAGVVGGFSEHAASPVIRIDYVQHAMAALGHGGKFLKAL